MECLGRIRATGIPKGLLRQETMLRFQRELEELCFQVTVLC